ncbi:MAG: helix-turn-helix domain-containing protein [Chloroflexi bacterium]|nr:MAG: helix-turn-helix domain-containing protein [Chloroflexota bacterium]
MRWRRRQRCCSTCTRAGTSSTRTIVLVPVRSSGRGRRWRRRWSAWRRPCRTPFKRGGDGGLRQPPVVVFRVPHVADMLAVSPSTVYRLVRRGELVAWLDRKQRESEIRGWFAPGRLLRVLTGGRDDGAADEAG